MAALSWKESEYRCLVCGGEIADGLARLGAVMCHDCTASSGVSVYFSQTPEQPRTKTYLPRFKRRKPLRG
jgi:hypothetical protein